MDTQSNPHIPVWVKLAYTAFIAVLVPIYLKNYGPSNFVYLCDLALFLTFAAVWTENPLLAGIPAVGIFLPQMFWCLDFLCGLFGFFPLAMTEYMFDPNFELHLRALSLFHGWLPFFLLWLVLRLGYDHHSFVAWWAISWAAMFVAFFFLPATKDPDNPKLPYNVNYVYGLDEPQTWMADWAWFTLILLAVPLLFTLPTHVVFKKLIRPVDSLMR